MTVEFEHYEGREPAFVKHTFLDKYLPSLIGKVASRFDEFVYVDGFAGPWKSVAGERFEDTSFGIALKHMTALRLQYLGRGRDVRMRAILVEKNVAAFQQLQEAVKNFPKVDIETMNGEFEDFAKPISVSLNDSAFLFSLIDPKGFPRIERILPLLARPNSEALVNFMYDHASRFAATGLIASLERWLSVGGKQGWQTDLVGLEGAAREAKLEELAVDGLKRSGSYSFSPVISVDKASHDRTLYKLIFLTRHAKGLEVFRQSELKALEAQAAARTSVKSRKREERSGMDDLFATDTANTQSDRSALLIRNGKSDGREALLSLLKNAGDRGLVWENIWPIVLTDHSITKSSLGLLANKLRKQGMIVAPSWPSERHRQPAESQRLVIV